MIAAEDLLKNSTEKVESIMHKIGYTDKKLFYKHFKDHFGMSPGEYRKQNRQ